MKHARRASTGCRGPGAKPGGRYPRATVRALFPALGLFLLVASAPQPQGHGDDTRTGARLETAARIAAAWRAFFDVSAAAALPAFQALADEAPGRADVQYGLGRCHLELKEIPPARRAFEQALRIDPSRPEYRFYLGVTWYQEKAFERALEVWKELDDIMTNPVVSRALRRDAAWLMARAYLVRGEPDQASRYFELAMTRLGAVKQGRLDRPAPQLERTLDGTLPADRWEPLPERLPMAPGQRIAFASQGAIWMIQGTGYLRERITTPPPGWRDDFPAQRPGDGRLAFIATDPRGRTWLMWHKEDGTRTLLIDTPVLPVAPSWSNQGNLLAFCRLNGNPPTPRIAVMDMASRQVRDLSLNGRLGSEPDFGPGMLLGLVVAKAPALAMATYDLMARQLRIVHPLMPHLDGDAPATRPGPPPRAWTARRAGKPPRPPLPVVDPWAASAVPAASNPAGHHESLERASGEETGARAAAPAESGVILRLAAAAGPTLSPKDRDTMAFTRQVRGRWRVYLVSGPDRMARPMSPPDMDCHSPAFSPDGDALVYVCQRGGRSRPVVQRVGERTGRDLYDQILPAAAPDWVQLSPRGSEPGTTSTDPRGA